MAHVDRCPDGWWCGGGGGGGNYIFHAGRVPIIRDSDPQCRGERSVSNPVGHVYATPATGSFSPLGRDPITSQSVRQQRERLVVPHPLSVCVG